MSILDIKRKIKHREKQRDWYSNDRAKKVWQSEINKLKKLLNEVTQ